MSSLATPLADAETRVAGLKSEIANAKRHLHDSLGYAAGIPSDNLSRQSHQKIAALNADLIEAEAILSALADLGQE